MEHGSDDTLRRYLREFDDQPIPTGIPSSLPLLDDLLREHPFHEVFAGVDTLFIQHHLAPLVPRVQGMVREGLDLSRCWFVDVPYSTNDRARQGLTGLGHPKAQRPEPFDDPLEAYAESQIARVERILEEIADRDSPRRLLVLDDGAYFSRSLARLLERRSIPASAFRGARIVEQTTYGHRYLGGTGREALDSLRMPAVSIARCETKLGFESPFIGASVSRAMLKALSSFDGGVDRLDRVAVIGFGAVGRATVRRLMEPLRGKPVDVVDTDPATHQEIFSLGCRPLSSLDPAREYDLVAGCTGYASFNLSQRAQLADGAVLVSGSSAAIEFNREGFIELADASPDDEIEVLDRQATREEGIHAAILMRQEGRKRFSFLNAGFPVNFDGALECLPLPAIQPTHCLMVAAARQAIHATEPGLQPIHPMMDEWIHRHALESLAAHCR